MYNSNKRKLVVDIESELVKLAATHAESVTKIDLVPLRLAFTKLVEALALGPEPKTRACPKCGRLGMRAATVCGYCWTKTPPIDA